MDLTQLQQTVMDPASVVVDTQEAAYDPPMSYDDVFPALPEAAAQSAASANTMGQWNQKMRVGTTEVTQVFRVPFEERKCDASNKFGEGDSMKTCGEIMQKTGAHIEISTGKDQSLTFLVTGKNDSVLKAKKNILENFQTLGNKTINIPKEHHRFVLGKGGKKLNDLEVNTGTKITIPNQMDQSDVITIVGTKESIDKAVHEIQVISDEQSKQAYERLEIPKMYHPFIAGAHNEKVTAIMNETGIRVNIPPLSVMKNEITVAGEKEGVIQAVETIINIYKEMEAKCRSVPVEVPKSQHKYVIGPRGTTVSEILHETGVFVEIPASDSSSDTITLRGPHDKLGQALTMVYAKASSVKIDYVECPMWIHRFIIGKKGTNIKLITQDLPRVHVEFTDKIKIEGPPEEVEEAKRQLEATAKDLASRLTSEELEVDPKYHKHIIGKQGARVIRIKQETGVVINIPVNEVSNIIRIEGSHNGVARAKQELMEMVQKMENEKERDIIIEQRFHRTIIGNKGENIQKIRENFNQVQISFPDASDKSSIVKIRGPKDIVDQCYLHLSRLNKEMIEDNHQAQVPIYKQYHKFIIGKAGANIRKIRDETNTRIELPSEDSDSDIIRITGKKENVEEARLRIQKQQDGLANIVQLDIMIPSKFHNSIIGTGGKLIQSIMEDCGGVQIKFPLPDSHSDKVTIRGPKEDVHKAKQILVELSNEKQVTNFNAEVRARPEHHRFLIGRSGAKIKKLRDSTNTRIIFPNDNDTDKEFIAIIGRKEDVKKAKAELEVWIKDLDKIETGEMRVDPKFHRHFVARRGEVLRQIGDMYGGVTVSFPRSGDTGDVVQLKGAKECVEAAKQRIQEIVADLQQMVTLECVIPQKYHGTVMGSKGHKVQAITSEFDVQVKFPDREVHNEAQLNGDVPDEPKKCDIIRIMGKKDKCERAKAALLALVPVILEVNVPFDFHRFIIGQSGKVVREMMDDFDVNITVPPVSQQSDIIKVSGTPANAEKARLALLDKVEQLEGERQDRMARSFEVNVEIDPEYHPKIIGRRGAVISKIRDQHGVQIQFPRKGDENESMISITGYEESAKAARDDILRLIGQLDDMVKVSFTLDPRIHSRIIGTRGRNIRKIMDEYKVDIRFPRSGDESPDSVIIAGMEEDVTDAKYHLLNLEEEFLQDVIDNEWLQQYSYRHDPTEKDGQKASKNEGFVVKGGPWEQKAPNTQSNEEFPSFGDVAPANNPGPVPWGPRR